MSRTPDLPPDLTRREVRSGLLQGFWAILEERTDPATVREIIAESGLPEEVARNASGWLSYAYYDRLNRVVARRVFELEELPGSDHELWQMWRHAPVHAMERMGGILTLFRSFSSTEGMYRAVANMAAMGNVGLRVKHLGLGPGLVRFEVRAADDVAAVGPATIWKVFGWLEQMQTIFGLPPATVRMETTEEDGRPLVRYLVEYRHGSADRRLLVGLGVLGAATGAALGPLLQVPTGFGALLGATLVLAVAGWARLLRRTRAAERDGERLRALIEELDERYVSERRARLTTRKLSGYLAAELVEEILADPDADVRLGGENTAAAVLFTDIVAFTPRCEEREPEAIVQELNTWFSFVDPIFARHGGVIDKRIGDGIMVVFASRGARGEEEVCHAAVSAAVECLRAVAEFSGRLQAQGAPALEVRVGLAYGPLIQGHMGSDERLEYTVIGDTVNLAARLESRARPGCAMTDRATWEAAGRHAGAAIAAEVAGERQISVKGKSRDVEVVELTPA